MSSRPVAPPSKLDNDMYRAIERAGRLSFAGSPVLPGMLAGCTDMALSRARGIQSYGIGPPATLNDQTNFGPHSDVERILESSLYQFVEFTWNVVTGVAGKQ